jgi:hypothetical protein
MTRTFLVLAALAAGACLSCHRQEQAHPSQVASPTPLRVPPIVEGPRPDGREYFSYETLNGDLVRLADEDYGQSRPDYSDPDNAVGTPPFRFVKRIDCDVISVDEEVERLIKKSPETASYHTILILRDARADLYAFTLTSTVPNKSVVRLQHYGPLTDENPTVVNLPISRRRLNDFPVDFNTGRPFGPRDGRCVYIPYPFPADQEYWLFGSDPHTSPLQGLYRNDRYKNVDEIIGLIVEGVKRQEASTQGIVSQ